MQRRFLAIYTFCFLLIFSLPCFSQTANNIDRLKASINAAPSANNKIKALLAFCDEWESYSADTLKKYAVMVNQLAMSEKDTGATILSSYYLAVWLFQQNKLDTALARTNEVVDSYKKHFPYDENYAKIYGLRSNILLRTSSMSELMASNFELMKMAEASRDTLGIARGMLGIGNANMKLKKYDEALHWYHQALGFMQNPVYKVKLSFIYNNIAIVFYHLRNEDSATYYIRQGLNFSREGSLTNLANALSIQGGLMAEFNHLKEAEASFKEAVAVRKKMGDIYYLINDMSMLALFYAHNKQPEKGIALCKEGLALSEQNGKTVANITDLYSTLGTSYLAAGDYKNYSDVLSKELELKDSLYKKNSAEAMAEMQAKYDLQQNEKVIIQQKLALVSKNYQLYGSLALLLLVIAFSYVLFGQYRRKQKLKLQLMQEEEKRSAEKAVSEAEEAERKRIAADLHDSLGAYAASIASNVDQINFNPLLPGNTIPLQQLRNNSQAIVSQLGDTIWALKKNALSLTAISDRIKVFVQGMQSSYPTITIDVLENITNDYLLSPAQAFHLFQIIKEAVTNALRHSKGTYLSVMIHADKKWKVIISDDGDGIAQKVTIAEGGNGLMNMKSRARESGWNIEWQVNEPKGTQVIIEPTTN